MHSHDLELIASLAEGSLQDETEARRLIRDCKECRLEHQMQLASIEALGSLGPAPMTDPERAALHRDVWAGLRADTPAPTRGALWHRWAYVAAGLFVVVGIGGALYSSAISGGESDGAGMFVAADASATTQAGATAESAEEPDAPMTTLAAPTAGGDTGGSGTGDETVTFDFAEVAETARESVEPGEERALADPTEEQSRCIEQAGLGGYALLDTVDEDGSSYLLVVPDEEDVGDETPVSFVDAVGCTVVRVED